MMLMKRLLLSAALLLGLSSCTNYVSLDTTHFYLPDFPRSGAVFIVAADPKINESLEFAHYKPMMAAKLQEQGYAITDDKDKADIVALFTFGIDNGQTVTKTHPIYGYTGYYGRYSMPHYTVVGISTSESTEFTRAIAMDLVDAQSIRDGKTKKLYEVRVKSRGRCSTLTQVFPQMLSGMFSNFPGESGKTQSIEVEGDDC